MSEQSVAEPSSGDRPRRPHAAPTAPARRSARSKVRTGSPFGPLRGPTTLLASDRRGRDGRSPAHRQGLGRAPRSRPAQSARGASAVAVRGSTPPSRTVLDGERNPRGQPRQSPIDPDVLHTAALVMSRSVRSGPGARGSTCDEVSVGGGRRGRLAQGPARLRPSCCRAPGPPPSGVSMDTRRAPRRRLVQ